MSCPSWIDVNQRVLAAEFARLRARLAGTASTTAEDELIAARSQLDARASIDVLVDTFRLSGFERDILLLCAGIEMNAALADTCALLPGAGGSPTMSFSLALARLADAHWSALSPTSPLRAWRLIELRDERSLSASRLHIDERVLHYLAGLNYLDPRLRAIIRVHEDEAMLSDSQQAVVTAALETLETGASVVQLLGDDAIAQREVARQISRNRGATLHVLRAADIPASPHEADALSLLWSRETLLAGAALFIEAGETESASVAYLAEGLGGLLFIGGRSTLGLRRSFRSFAIDRALAAEQKSLWKQALGVHATALNGSLDSIAAQYRVSSDVMTRAAEAVSRQPDHHDDVEHIVRRACRDSTTHQLAQLAQHVVSPARWQDLVLPEPQLSTLRQVVAHVRNQLRVFGEWGFAGKSSRGIGTSVLFTGESGTGKTMAAEVLANELHLDLYRIDLASMVSKYIGETEKNLRRVFDAAEDSGAILLFDEADALFGKRSEVNDSHDRYANIEVSYLLQRMETYRGLAILTTNLKGSLDVAFQRRLRFVVPFVFPDQALRERIWRGAFPDSTPVEKIDYRKLSQLNVAGGNIRNIALNAAFIAAEADTVVGMNHLLQAAKSEATKRERPYSDAETRGWV